VTVSYPEPLPGNPREFTIDQHVFPVESLSRFTDQGGLLMVRRNDPQRVLKLRPTNVMFCAKRAWDERTEKGLMKQIWVMIRTEALGKWLAAPSLIEHTAGADAVDMRRLNTESDDPAREDIHDEHHPGLLLADILSSTCSLLGIRVTLIALHRGNWNKTMRKRGTVTVSIALQQVT